MEQTIFEESGEELILKGLGFPLSIEERIAYLRAVANQLEQDFSYKIFN